MVIQGDTVVLAQGGSHKPKKLKGLNSILIRNVKKQFRIKRLFHMQHAVIQHILDLEARAIPGDVSLCAPTGSGKTISYALPVLNGLLEYRLKKLRALILVPTRDLATQVLSVFRQLAKDTDIKVEAITGQTSTKKEAQLLLSEKFMINEDDDDDNNDNDSGGGFDNTGPGTGVAINGDHHAHNAATPVAGSAFWDWRVDVLVATPGKLVEHLDKTRGFSLEFLKYLVIDESDKLLDQTYHNWLDAVLPVAGVAIDPTRDRPRTFVTTFNPVMDMHPIHKCVVLTAPPQASDSHTAHPIEGAPIGVKLRNYGGFPSNINPARNNIPTRKILASATQGLDIDKLVKLRLENLVFFETKSLHSNTDQKKNRSDTKMDINKKQDTTLQERDLDHNKDSDYSDDENLARDKNTQFQTPETLLEKVCVCVNAQDKLLVLVRLLGTVTVPEIDRRVDVLPNIESVAVFTKSLESAHKLSRLLELFYHDDGKKTIHEFSGSFSREYRRDFIAKLKSNDLKDRQTIVVCSDVLSRGIDIPTVRAVINYDAPMDLQTYIHRVGRTARAGEKGTSVSLVQWNQAHHFKKMIKKIDRGSRQVVSKEIRTQNSVKCSVIETKLEEALFNLEKAINYEKLGILKAEMKLPHHLRSAMMEKNQKAIKRSWSKAMQTEQKKQKQDLGEEKISEIFRGNEERGETLLEVMKAKIFCTLSEN